MQQKGLENPPDEALRTEPRPPDIAMKDMTGLGNILHQQ